MFLLDRAGFDRFLRALADAGYRVRGLVAGDGAVVVGDVACADDFPRGLRDELGPGRYRLTIGAGAALFGTRVGPASFKPEFLPPERVLWSAHRTGRGFAIDPPAGEPAPVALVGVRPCDLAAMAVQDRVLAAGPYADPVYAARRAGSFVVVVHCTEPAATCFCASMGSGPEARGGYDVALTELSGAGTTRFVAESGTDRGRAMLGRAGASPAPEADVREALGLRRAAAGRMGRSLDADRARDGLLRRFEHPRWDEIGERCLACGNCTAVCPTCFCHTVEDVTSLDGERAERVRRRDSCFTHGFSSVHGGAVRASRGARYRQWLTHKLATWVEQFGTPGCVGCGRCIVWCPVGIDLTEEAAALAGPAVPGPAAPRGEEAR